MAPGLPELLSLPQAQAPWKRRALMSMALPEPERALLAQALLEPLVAARRALPGLRALMARQPSYMLILRRSLRRALRPPAISCLSIYATWIDPPFIFRPK
jgi:hypothetical protein